VSAIDVADFEELSDEELLMIAEAYLHLESEEREAMLARLVEQAILIEGKKGRGKSLAAMAIAWWLRELFGRPVITVGSKMGLRTSFGPHKVMSELAFRDELNRLSIVSNEQDNAEQVALAFEKYGISILYSTIIFDEAYKLFNARNPMDKLIQLFGFFVAQSRHYHVTILLLTPDRSMIDGKRVRPQMDWNGRVYHNKYTNKARLRLVAGIETMTLTVDGKNDPSPNNSFYNMYDSWALLGMLPSQLAIKT
jgi:hypothetical protein